MKQPHGGKHVALSPGARVSMTRRRASLQVGVVSFSPWTARLTPTGMLASPGAVGGHVQVWRGVLVHQGTLLRHGPHLPAVGRVVARIRSSWQRTGSLAPHSSIRYGMLQARNCMQQLVGAQPYPRKVVLKVADHGVFVVSRDSEEPLLMAPLATLVSLVAMKKAAEARQTKLACFLKSGPPIEDVAVPYYGFVLEFDSEADVRPFAWRLWAEPGGGETHQALFARSYNASTKPTAP